MKLLYCDNCSDVVAINIFEWRKCKCGRVGGAYNEDALTATIGGPARVFGVANPFFDPDYEKWSPAKRGAVHRKWGYGPHECWWGGHPGDWQLIRIKNPNGPRLSHRRVLKRIQGILLERHAPEEVPALFADIKKQLNERRADFRARVSTDAGWKKFRAAG